MDNLSGDLLLPKQAKLFSFCFNESGGGHRDIGVRACGDSIGDDVAV